MLLVNDMLTTDLGHNARLLPSEINYLAGHANVCSLIKSGKHTA